MAVTPQFTASGVRKFLEQQKQRFERAALQRLIKVGEDFITNARNNETYKDQTGNLRSSIGYVILKNGVQVAGSMPGNKSEAIQKAEAVIRRLLGEQIIVSGYVLIVIAGMEYAAAVEAKGYDVLTASGIKAGNDLKKALQKLQK